MRRTLDSRELQQRLRVALERSGVAARHRLHVDQHSDPIDEARWSEDASVAIEELDVAWRLRREAIAALDRLREGRYGVCVTCGREISEARLRALPWAARCVGCESRREAMAGSGSTGPSSIRDWLDANPDAA